MEIDAVEKGPGETDWSTEWSQWLSASRTVYCKRRRRLDLWVLFESENCDESTFALYGVVACLRWFTCVIVVDQLSGLMHHSEVQNGRSNRCVLLQHLIHSFPILLVPLMIAFEVS